MSASSKHCSAVVLGLSLLVAGCQPSASNPQPAGSATTPGTPQESAAATEPPLTFVAPGLTEEEIREGWISLFDGVSLFGWSQVNWGLPENNGANWHVEEGCLVADGKFTGLLTTPFHFRDFEFRCDFHLAAGGNSGVFLRSNVSPTDPTLHTYELNICDSHDTFPTGSLVGRHKVDNVPAVEGSWHSYRVRCEGNRIQVWLDDKPVTDYSDDSEQVRYQGSIGLQKLDGRIEFRNIFLRPLGTQELFNGTSLEGWSEVDGSSSEFSVVEHAIHVSNGPGFLQTDSTWDNFVLQVEARINGDALNSGVFFRAMPGTAEAPSHGYEMQLQNGFTDGDRTQPADSGTGAIFRRATARYVVANDREWLTATLIAQGDHFATWVNGYQVVDWQDDRDADENPRRGERLEAGHISLQGHDPTTDLDFRTIRIHDLNVPAR